MNVTLLIILQGLYGQSAVYIAEPHIQQLFDGYANPLGLGLDNARYNCYKWHNRFENRWRSMLFNSTKQISSANLLYQAGGVGSSGQNVGSMLITDSIFSNLQVGISTTLVAENSTSFLIQNTKFGTCGVSIQDAQLGTALIAGTQAYMLIDSWGFGKIVSAGSSTGTFQNGNSIPAANRTQALLLPSSNAFFTRRLPTYQDIAASEMINIKSQGAKGDGVTDDAALINQVLAAAANASRVVFFPFGVYLVSDTVRIPTGSRIVGQAWSQIMATGSNFQDASRPRVVVKIGNAGESGVIEISDMMITVSGPTAGAVLMEWNVHESIQGSAALWSM